MRKGVLIEGAEIPGTETEPTHGLQNLTAAGDEIRALLALCLAGCLLSVYTVAWATSLYS